MRNVTISKVTKDEALIYELINEEGQIVDSSFNLQLLVGRARRRGNEITNLKVFLDSEQ